MALGSFRFQPLGKRVIIRMDDPTAWEGRFSIPEKNRTKAATGRVLVLGMGSKAEVVPGNRVVVNIFGKKDVVIDGIPMGIFEDHHLLAVIPETGVTA